MDCFVAALLAMTAGGDWHRPLPPIDCCPRGQPRQEKSREAIMTARLNRARTLFGFIFSCIASFCLSAPSHAGDIPTFAVDAAWPKPLPNNWILGQVGGITVDWQGHIWVIHR